jgi:probable rRNA maturation factor
MSLTLDLQVACDQPTLPTPQDFQCWLDLVCDHARREETEVTVRIVTAEESQQLNHQYRGKQSPTNVLAFPFESPREVELPLLGDIVICAEIVAQEAKQQHKLPFNHWAHLTVHGGLHLLGYDHIEEQAAQQMESIEIALLKKIGIDDPYQDH